MGDEVSTSKQGRTPTGPVIELGDAEESARIVTETASDAIITIDEESTILFTNRAAETIFGYSVDEMLGKSMTMLMPDYLRHVHRAGIKRYLETGERHVSWEAVELPGLHKSGHEIRLEISFGEFTRDGKHFFTGVARDITRRKRDERRADLQHAVTRILSESTTLNEASARILAAIGLALGWDLGGMWAVDPNQQELRLVNSWHLPTLDCAEFEEASRQSVFTKGVGLPGLILATKLPQWVRDFGNDVFPRSSIAARQNLHAAFAFPILLGGEILGVIEFFSHRILQPDEELLKLTSAIGSQIGQFSERQRAQAAVRKWEEVFKHAGWGVTITDPETNKLQSLNEAFARMHGYTIRELIGMDLVDILAAESQAELAEHLRIVHEQGHHTYESVHIRKDGTSFPILTDVTAVKDEHGRILYRAANFRDITEQKNAEAEKSQLLAREQEARRDAEAVSRQLGALQKVTDAALSYLSLNDFLSELLNRIRNILQVDTVAILLLERKGDQLIAWAARGLEEEVERGLHIPIGKGFAGRIAAEAKPLIIDDLDKAEVFNPLLREKGIRSLLGVPMLIEGRVVGVLHVGTLNFHGFTNDDVRLLQLVADRIALASENARLYQVERRARAEAEEANKAKDEFLTILSHELRTPLTPIVGWVHMMREGILSERDSAQALSVVSRNSQAMKHLINDLLDMSAIMSGKMRIEEAPVSLQESVCEAVDALRPQAVERNIRLDLSPLDRQHSLIVKGDRTRLVQVFSNLVHNAIKFSEAGSVIHISCVANGNEAVVRVKDEGDGIAPEFLPYVFDRFRQSDGSRTRSHGGLGLGLALVKNFVEAHRGTVEATSGGQSQGSIFTVRLPLSVPLPSVATSSGEITQATLPDPRVRILIVEDEADTLEMLGAIFETRGFETRLCESGAEALKIAEEHYFNVIISDIAMPAMDGYEMIKRLRRKPRYRFVPAVALTGYASEKDAKATLAAGFDVHIPKPVDPIELTTAIEALLESKSIEVNRQNQ
jgi:PAS domain S-box-containing protein